MCVENGILSLTVSFVQILVITEVFFNLVLIHGALNVTERAMKSNST